MSRKTKGTIVVSVEIETNGHVKDDYFISQITGNIQNNKCFGKVKMISLHIQWETFAPKVDEGVRDLNTLKKIIKSAIPEELKCYMTGSKFHVSVDLYISKSTMDKDSFYGETCLGSFSIEDQKLKYDTMVHDDGSHDCELSMGDPKFIENLRDLIDKEWHRINGENWSKGG